MADRGFEPIAMIRHNRRSSYLELTIREMRAMSGLNGQNLSGHLAALRYQYRDTLKAVEIRGGKIRIPLDACSYQPCGHRRHARKRDYTGRLLCWFAAHAGERCETDVYAIKKK